MVERKTSVKMRKYCLFGLSLVCVLLLAGCKKDNGKGGGQSTVPSGKRQTLVLASIDELNQAEVQANSHRQWIQRSILSPVAGTYIQLDKGVLQEEMPIYPRFIKTDDGDYLMFFHGGNSSTWAGNECSYARSKDLINWTFEKKLFAAKDMIDCTGASNRRGYAGANLLKLKDGSILAVASTRAIRNFRERVPDNGLAIRISMDGGHSWGDEQLVFVGSNWEPMPVLLPNGHIQIYYTDSQKLNSDAFGAGNEVISTGSSYIESADGGKTWSYGSTAFADHARGFAQIRYTFGSQQILTDQMPAVIALSGSSRLAAAAESFIGDANYKSYVSLAYSDENGNWGTPDGDGVLPRDRVNKFTSGCAPYLVQFPSGETVLSYNASNVFYMRQGDADGKNFGEAVKVFGQTLTTGKGFWGALYCPDNHRMVAGVGGSGNVIQVGQFFLNHALHAATHAVTVDGNNSEWKNMDDAWWICSQGDTKATVRCATDATNVYFLFEVSDKDISKDDYIQVFVSDPEKEDVGATSVRVKASFEGLKTQGNYAGGWREKDFGASVSSSYDGTPSYNSDTDNGYLVEISLPKASLPIKNGILLANCALFDIRNGGEDALTATADKSTGKWVPILGL